MRKKDKYVVEMERTIRYRVEVEASNQSAAERKARRACFRIWHPTFDSRNPRDPRGPISGFYEAQLIGQRAGALTVTGSKAPAQKVKVVRQSFMDQLAAFGRKEDE